MSIFLLLRRRPPPKGRVWWCLCRSALIRVLRAMPVAFVVNAALRRAILCMVLCASANRRFILRCATSVCCRCCRHTRCRALFSRQERACLSRPYAVCTQTRLCPPAASIRRQERRLLCRPLPLGRPLSNIGGGGRWREETGEMVAVSASGIGASLWSAHLPPLHASARVVFLPRSSTCPPGGITIVGVRVE